MGVRERMGTGLLVLAMLAMGPGFRATADEPPASSGQQPQDPGVQYDAARTAAERLINVAAYADQLAGIRQYLLHEHLGAWIAIAGGRLFPVNTHGTAVEPAATMDDAVAAARVAVPDARHRFVFRVGEDGDLRQSLGGVERSHVFGVWFLAKLERPDVESRALGPRQPIHFVKGAVRTELTTKGPDDRMFVRPEVGPPGAQGRKDSVYCLSTGFSGYATLSADTAAVSSLHLWEVPGMIMIEGVLRKGACRRARVRVRFTDTDLDFLLPVAIWPEQH